MTARSCRDREICGNELGDCLRGVEWFGDESDEHEIDVLDGDSRVHRDEVDPCEHVNCIDV